MFVSQNIFGSISIVPLGHSTAVIKTWQPKCKQGGKKSVTYWKYLDPFIDPDLDRLSEAERDLRRDTDLDRRGDADLDLKMIIKV